MRDLVRKADFLSKLLPVCLVFLLLFPMGRKTWAVTEGMASWTAEYVAYMRALAALDPDEKIRNPDSMAGKFIHPDFWATVPGLSLDFPEARRTIDVWKVAVYYYVNARTKHIDALLREAVAGGATQVVILGAGYDSRAYRFHSEMPQVTFFEVDLPETQAAKKKKVTELLGAPPSWVSFAPIDFNKDTLESVLARQGFRKDVVSFFIWEGVSFYISAEGVESTLRCISRESAPGSTLVFDYVLSPVIRGDYRYYRARAAAEVVAEKGEPFTFGIDEGQAGHYLNLQGLALVYDLGPPELTSRYLSRSDGRPDGKMSGFFRIASAAVPKPGERGALISKALLSRGKTAHPEERQALEPPRDIGAFLDEYCAALSKHDVSAVMSSYSDSYLDGGEDKLAIQLFWDHSLMRPSYRAMKGVRIFLTRCEVKGDRAEINGYIRSSIGLDPLTIDPDEPAVIVREQGRWKWYGNQRKGPS
ncbi:MAG: SAM-dependent methyltransferase [Candidatus Eremiobacteraeota bacterium]|nr:SAM-dependent methyltransferase [Candidatus Eremiobacteraeota bacterium]